MHDPEITLKYLIKAVYLNNLFTNIEFKEFLAESKLNLTFNNQNHHVRIDSDDSDEIDFFQVKFKIIRFKK